MVLPEPVSAVNTTISLLSSAKSSDLLAYLMGRSGFIIAYFISSLLFLIYDIKISWFEPPLFLLISIKSNSFFFFK